MPQTRSNRHGPKITSFMPVQATGNLDARLKVKETGVNGVKNVEAAIPEVVKACGSLEVLKSATVCEHSVNNVKQVVKRKVKGKKGVKVDRVQTKIGDFFISSQEEKKVVGKEDGKEKLQNDEQLDDKSDKPHVESQQNSPEKTKLTEEKEFVFSSPAPSVPKSNKIGDSVEKRLRSPSLTITESLSLSPMKAPNSPYNLNSKMLSPYKNQAQEVERLTKLNKVKRKIAFNGSPEGTETTDNVPKYIQGDKFQISPVHKHNKNREAAFTPASPEKRSAEQEALSRELKRIPSPKKAAIPFSLADQQSRLFNKKPLPELLTNVKKPETTKKVLNLANTFSMKISKLQVPKKYQPLLEAFGAIEMVLQIKAQRGEKCAWEALKTGVERITKTTFDQKMFGQIINVYPEAYTVYLAKKMIGPVGSSIHREESQLTIDPNFTDKIETSSTGQIQQFVPFLTVARKDSFRRRLLEITRGYHTEYIKHLQEQAGLELEKWLRTDLVSWHPDFPINDVPEILAHELPGENEVIRSCTAGALLEAAGRAKNERVRNALESAGNDKLRKEVAEKEKSTSILGKSSMQKLNVKGINMDLLGRIANKTNQRAKWETIRDSKYHHNLNLLGLMPEGLLKIRGFSAIGDTNCSSYGMRQIIDYMYKQFRTKQEKTMLEEVVVKMSDIIPDYFTIRNITPNGQKEIKIINKCTFKQAMDSITKAKVLYKTHGVWDKILPMK